MKKNVHVNDDIKIIIKGKGCGLDSSGSEQEMSS
jgi:hypothetical protein